MVYRKNNYFDRVWFLILHINFNVNGYIKLSNSTILIFASEFFIFIGLGTFRISGGGTKGEPKSQQAHDVVLTSMRRNDVASTSFRRHVHTRFLINQC